MNKMWQRVITVSILCSISIHGHATSGLQSTKLAASISGLPPVFVTVEKQDGLVVSRTSGGKKTAYFYDDGLLARTEQSGVLTAVYFYHRNGQLDRSELSNGFVHTAQYDELGKLNAIISTSGRALRITGNAVSGQTAQKVTADRIVSPPNTNSSRGAKSNLNGGAGQVGAAKTTQDRNSPSITTVLLATEGWDSGAVGTDSCDKEPNDPTRVTDPVHAASMTAAMTAEVEPPSTDCTIVVVPGTGESGGSGGSYGGGVVTDPPGSAPADNPLRAACMGDAYEGWQLMDKFICKPMPIYREKLLCNEGNMKTYRDAIDACYKAFPG